MREGQPWRTWELPHLFEIDRQVKVAIKVTQELTTNKVLNSRRLRLNTAKYMQVEGVDRAPNQEVVLDKSIRTEGMIRTRALPRIQLMQNQPPGRGRP